MINSTIVQQRLGTCKQCEFWKGACLKGHNLTSYAGCPVKKFDGVSGAGYAPDVPVLGHQPQCASSKTTLNPLNIAASFAESMKIWAREGYKLVDESTHAKRYNICQRCPNLVNHTCNKCWCVMYLKSKLAGMKCPDNPPRWT